jgi:hypothetical protein
MFACKETYKMASEKKYFYNSSYIIKHSSLTHLLYTLSFKHSTDNTFIKNLTELHIESLHRYYFFFKINLIPYYLHKY